jgi:hypothetical protein
LKSIILNDAKELSTIQMNAITRTGMFLLATLLLMAGCSSPPADVAGSVTPSVSTVQPNITPSITPTASAATTPEPTNVAKSTPSAVDAPTTVFDQLQFIDESHGWAASRDQFGAEMSGLWNTGDGGLHWHKYDVPALYLASFRFADAKSGWLAGYTECKADKGIYRCGKLVVYQSVDAGAHWREQWSATGHL